MDKRRYNWRHSSLIGSALCGKANMKRIQDTESASLQAKAIAREIELEMNRLATILMTTRVEPDGSITDLKGKKR